MRPGPWLVLVMVAGVGTLSCSHVLALVPGPAGEILSAQAARGEEAALQNAPERLRDLARCQELEKVPIALEEEKSFGGAVAVALAQKGNGLTLEVSGQTDELRNPDSALKKIANTPAKELTRYLNRVGKNLGAQSDRPYLNWTFGIIDSDDVNAFSAPGGYVFVTLGLLRKVDNEAQLAGVLAHEISHVSLQHALRRYRKFKVSMCQAAVGGRAWDDFTSKFKQDAEALSGIFQRVIAPGNSNGYVNLDAGDSYPLLKDAVASFNDSVDAVGFTASDEYEADQKGLELALNAGYRPKEFIAFLGKLSDSGGIFPHHPPPRERQQKLSAWLASLQNDKDFLAAADYPFDKNPYVLGPPVQVGPAGK